MTSFDATRRLEAEAWSHLEPFISKHSNGKYVPTLKGLLSETVQRDLGIDVWTETRGEMKGLELKCEEQNKYGNFFLETWSNKAFGRARDGWMMTCKADTLLYYFLTEGQLFVIPFRPLWYWFFGDPDKQTPGVAYVGRFPEKSQKRHPQKNATCGHPVPIEAVAGEVGLTEWSRLPDGTFSCKRIAKPKMTA